MADEKAAGNNPANPGSNAANSNANKGTGKSNRRRSLRSKRRGRKPEEANEAREQRESRPPREPRAQPNASNSVKAAEKSIAENRDRRRRRRMRAKQRGQSETAASEPVVVENTLKDLPPLVPAFVYTHVLRPSTRDTFEFRTEHFSKVTRKMEDFHIDLSPLYPDGGNEIKGVGYMPPLELKEGDDVEDEIDEELDGEFDADIDEGDDEGALLEDPDWDSEESGDAALLDGAIADEFYNNLDDSVIDVPSEDDLDAEELP
ncbi:MAG: hypothetical protein IT328_27625 [Caldilineaceae bacterium]|nr:hypothetical protein [Caldilineaceae bacterium]